jgi:hypothetical protein
LCSTGLVRFGNELLAAVVIGGIAPDDWPPDPNRHAALCAELGLEAERLRIGLEGAHRLDPIEKRTALIFAQRIADIVSHVGAEYGSLLDRLRSISDLSQV